MPVEAACYAAGKLIPSSRVQAAEGDDPQKARLLIRDRKSGISFLVDTGADISVLPRNLAGQSSAPSKLKLFAANNSVINTYGQKLLNLNFGLRRSFLWNFVIADVAQPIIGADFLQHFGLLVDLRGKNISDQTTNLSQSGKLVNVTTQSISTICHTIYNDILSEYKDITIPTGIKKLAQHNVFHHILTEGPPVAQRARRLSPEKLQEAKNEFNFMIQQGICQPSSSQWASPLHMVPKKNGQWRFCGDYRRLNAVTIPDRYPIAFLQDFAHQLHGKKVFSKIDLIRAYYQIPVAPGDVPKTAVITPFGLFEFNVMTFGLRNAAPTFQRYIDTALRGLEFCFALIDDILIASKDHEEHRQHLRIIFERLRQHGLCINVSKCVFGVPSVQYLGYQIDENGSKPMPDRILALANYTKPSTIAELRRFLGAINFYRKSLRNAAEIQAPLHELLTGSTKRDKRPVKWNPRAERAFEECKNQIANATLLRHPIPNATLSIQSDASDTAMGGVLEQFHNGNWEPLGYFSRKFTNAQQKYSTYDRELQAIYSCIKFFQHMVEGRTLIIKTDHKPLTFAFEQKAEKASPRQLRQLDYIGQFTTNIVYISGDNNIVADAFSRIGNVNLPTTFTTEELARAQKDDDELQDILRSNTSLDLRKLRIDDTETFVFCDISTKEIRPYIPKTLRKKIFDTTHRLSHPSGRATKKAIQRKFVWPSMAKDITEWSRTCLACQRSKIARHAKPSHEHIQVPDTRFSHVHIDIVGPLTQSKGYSYVLTMIDRFTRWPEAAPLKSITADAIADAFYTTWISRFGAPTVLTSDQGTQFESMLFKSLSHLVGCEKIRTTAYHPAANGMIERWHRSFKASIMCHNNAEWIDSLPTVLLGLRTSVKEDIGSSAAELVYGTTLRLPGEFFFNEDMPPDPKFFVEKFREIMRKVRPTPTKHHGKPKIFIHKDMFTCTHVFIRVDRVKKPLEHPYEGPFRVLERTSDNVFVIDVKGEATSINIERLKPAFIEAEPINPSSTITQPNPATPTLKTYPGPGKKTTKTKSVTFAA